jgi:prevent-host-death family protein
VGVKIVSITDVRQDATNLIRHVQESGEPILVVQRSKPAAYVIGATQFEHLQAELMQLRRGALLRDVAEAEAEARSGDLPVYETADALIASWDEDPAGRS